MVHGRNRTTQICGEPIRNDLYQSRSPRGSCYRYFRAWNVPDADALAPLGGAGSNRFGTIVDRARRAVFASTYSILAYSSETNSTNTWFDRPCGLWDGATPLAVMLKEVDGLPDVFGFLEAAVSPVTYINEESIDLYVIQEMNGEYIRSENLLLREPTIAIHNSQRLLGSQPSRHCSAPALAAEHIRPLAQATPANTCRTLAACPPVSIAK